MSNLKEWLAQIYAFMAMLPFLSFFLFWFVTYLIVRDKKRSTRTAVDVTTFFLLGSVYMMCEQTLSSVFLFWLAILLLLIAAGWIGREQNQKRGKILPLKIVRAVWRFAFLLFSMMYVLLSLVGIVQHMAMI